MHTVQLQKNSYFDIDLFDMLIESIKNFIDKYRLFNIESRLDNVIHEFSSLQHKSFVLQEPNDIHKYDNFLEYLEKLQDYLEQLEDLTLTTAIEQKLDNALDIVTLLQFRISGAMSDYRLADRCK